MKQITNEERAGGETKHDIAMRSKKDVKYTSDNVPKYVKKWIDQMEALLAKMPENIHLEADGSLHVFSKFKDGSIFEACTRAEGGTEANLCHLHTFKVYCDGGDFW